MWVIKKVIKWNLLYTIYIYIYIYINIVNSFVLIKEYICVLDRGRPVNDDIVSLLIIFAEGLLSLIVYCCNNRAVFRLSISALMVNNAHYINFKYSVVIFVLISAILANPYKFTSSYYWRSSCEYWSILGSYGQFSDDEFICSWLYCTI